MPKAALPKGSFAQRALNRKKHALHVFILSPVARFFHLFRPLSILLPIAILSLAHCSSGDELTDPAVYTCTNGTPSEGSPDGDSDGESCPRCDTGYSLVDGECSCTPGDTELLSSTLGIGDCGSAYSTLGIPPEGGGVDVWGYGGNGICSSHTGSLSEGGNFEIDGGTPYTIQELYRMLSYSYYYSDDDPDSYKYEIDYTALVLDLGRSGVPENIVLQLGSDEFTFADARVNPSNAYVWDDPGLTWTSGDLTVKIIERVPCP